MCWVCIWRHTCLLISAPASSSHNKHPGWPPKAAMCAGVCANLEVTAFTPQPTWTRRTTQSNCEEIKIRPMYRKLDRLQGVCSDSFIHWAGIDMYNNYCVAWLGFLAVGMHPINPCANCPSQSVVSVKQIFMFRSGQYTLLHKSIINTHISCINRHIFSV